MQNMLLVVLMAFSYKCFDDDEHYQCFKQSTETRALYQPTFTCSKSTMETPAERMKSLKR